MALKKIGILTGGGDVPGLNAVIKSVVYRGAENNIEVTGFRRGWEALTHLNLEDQASRDRYVMPLTRENTRTIDRDGGTMLHTSRTNPSKMKKVPDFLAGAGFPEKDGRWDMSGQVLKNLERLGIDSLIAIGGDDTLSFAARLNQLGVKVIAVPKTMDNDVQNTEYCIGFSTAVTRASDAIDRQLTTVGSHERIGIFRVFGRDAGYTALYTAWVASIRCVIPEYKVNLDKLIDLILTDKSRNPSNYALVVLSEGAQWEGYKLEEYGEPDAYGHRKKASIAETLSSEIIRRTGEETVVSDLTYDLRGGSPDFMDKLIASTFGTMAFEATMAGKSGLMAAIHNGCYDLVPIPDPKLGPRHLDVDTMYNKDRYRPNYTGKLGMPVFLTRA
jgi:ATP-dependent phosphofructokinase / diphosphate-dependent phosphofructokinase